MIKLLRMNMGLTQKALAIKIGITQSYMSKLENYDLYHKKVSVEIITKLAKELKVCPIDVFVYFTKNLSFGKLNCHFDCKMQNKL